MKVRNLLLAAVVAGGGASIGVAAAGAPPDDGFGDEKLGLLLGALGLPSYPQDVIRWSSASVGDVLREVSDYAGLPVEGVRVLAEIDQSVEARAIEVLLPRQVLLISQIVADSTVRPSQERSVVVDGDQVSPSWLHRMEYLSRLSEVARYYVQDEDWAGSYFDHASQRLVIMLADERSIETVAALSGREADVDVRVVARSELEWETIAMAFADAIGISTTKPTLTPEFDPRLNVSIVPDPVRQLLQVDVFDGYALLSAVEDIAEQVSRAYLIDVNVTVIKEPFQLDACNPSNCAPPLSGGIRLNGDDGGNCTFGFLFTSDGSSNRGSTAGHCGSTTFRHQGNFVGATAWQSVASNNIDVQLTTMGVAFWDPQATIFTFAGDYTQVKSQATQSGIPYNSFVCLVGATTYANRGGGPLECGSLVGKYATFFSNSNNLGKVDTCNSSGGDSGGPWFTGVAGGAQAVGIHKGSGGDFCYFSFTSDVQALTGWRPKTK